MVFLLSTLLTAPILATPHPAHERACTEGAGTSNARVFAILHFCHDRSTSRKEPFTLTSQVATGLKSVGNFSFALRASLE